MAGGVDDERAPAAADIEDGLTGRQLELAAHQIQLPDLRGLEGLGRIEEVGA